MIDKVQKIREKVEKLRIKNTEAFDCGCDGTKCAGYNMACDDILSFIDSMQEEPKQCMYSKDNYTDEDRIVLCGDCEEECEFNKKEEPVSEELEEASKEWLRPQLDKSYANYGEAKMMELTHFDGYAMLDAIEFGAEWYKRLSEKEVVLAYKNGWHDRKAMMMKDAVEYEVSEKEWNGDALIPVKGLHMYEKVKVIIIKED